MELNRQDYDKILNAITLILDVMYFSFIFSLWSLWVIKVSSNVFVFLSLIVNIVRNGYTGKL